MNKSIKFICLVLIPTTFLVACWAAARQELESVSLIVINGTVIDGVGNAPILDGLVVIEGNCIVGIGRADDFKIPEGVVVIDADGGTILPGIFNAHAHGVATAGVRRHLFVLDGVTSVCDLGARLAQMKEFEQEAFQSGPAVRGFKAGPIVTAPGGYPGAYFGLFEFNYEIQGEVEAEKAVGDLYSRGVDFIKVALEPGSPSEPFPTINLQELRAIVTAAHAHDLLVRVHLNRAMLDIALEGGVDVIEHVPLPFEEHEDLESMFDEAGVFRPPPMLETQLLRMIDQGVVMVPTLDFPSHEENLVGEINSEPEVFIQAIIGIVRFFHDAGGIIAVGNDYGNPRVQLGMPIREMELLQSAGLSPLEVIEAATKHAAFVCGQNDELGTLEIGKLADLIVVAGNPLEDMNALDFVQYVVKDGQVVVSSEQDTN